MRLLVHSKFYPSVGGIQTVASLLVHEWVKAGHAVTLTTDVTCRTGERKEFPFPVHYRVSPITLARLVCQSQAVLHLNISLKAFWPLTILRRPFIASHHSYYTDNDSRHPNRREECKLNLCQRATNIAASHAIASHISAPCDVIPNPFDDSLFRSHGNEPRETELAFVGRLVSDKGADLLIRSVAMFRTRGLRPRLSIIGDGPDLPALHLLVNTLGLQEQVNFQIGRAH